MMRLTTRLAAIPVYAATLLLIQLDARAAFAQQVGQAFAQPAANGPSVNQPVATQPTVPQPGNTPTSTADIERQLLEKINELEKRVAELEVRVPSSAPANTAALPAPAGTAISNATTSTNTN